MTKILHILLLISILALPSVSGYGNQLWLPQSPLHSNVKVQCNRSSPTVDIIMSELKALPSNSSVKITISRKGTGDGFSISGANGKYVITSATDRGALYAAYHLLRLQQMGQASNVDVRQSPSYQFRMLNHWDNLDGTIERGYAGRSILQWNELPNVISPRYAQYARANASIGINATVLNNVNAAPEILTTNYLQKVKAVADVLRPYGMQVFLSINFSSPAAIGNLSTSDPLNGDVRQWWVSKANEIYKLIPDFGGFLVKANSEGLPGPQDFGRTHADGANMLAEALEPHGGLVIWRAFVYSPGDSDRAKQAYQEFLPLDGQFNRNVIVQVKNGPVDFQPREPFSPLFGAMRQTPIAPELQITQEYTGFSNHTCFLASMWQECLQSDTYNPSAGATIAKVTDGSLRNLGPTAIAGVANIGDNQNWCGNYLAQANWYAFGRMAWNNNLTPRQIADEWAAQTFGLSPNVAEPLVQLLLMSHQAVVNYMMPMGLHHIFAWSHHYGPEPWCNIAGARSDWMPSYYHRADRLGIGFDRSPSGSNAVEQYAEPLRSQFANLSSCPEEYLLWFHHVPWNYRLNPNHTLWTALCSHYQQGVDSVRQMQKLWEQMNGRIDTQRFAAVRTKLQIQMRDAIWWRDACLQYFQTFSRLPLPSNVEQPLYDLEYIERFHINITNYECPAHGLF